VNGNKYWSRDSGSALHWEGNHRSGFAPAKRHRLCHIELELELAASVNPSRPTNDIGEES